MKTSARGLRALAVAITATVLTLLSGATVGTAVDIPPPTNPLSSVGTRGSEITVMASSDQSGGGTSGSGGGGSRTFTALLTDPWVRRA